MYVFINFLASMDLLLEAGLHLALAISVVQLLARVTGLVESSSALNAFVFGVFRQPIG